MNDDTDNKELSARKTAKFLFIGGIAFIILPVIALQIFGDMDLRCVLIPAWIIGVLMTVSYFRLLANDWFSK